jgi:alpha-tubulin suppressor-like RCC1 family protein
MRGRTRLLVCSAVVALALAAPAAQASAFQACTVQHWGSFSGGNASDQDITLSPAGVTIPDASLVVQVGSSNSTQYALLANGTLWAWGQGLRGQLGNGSHASLLNTPVRVKFPAGVSIAYIAVNSMPFDTAFAVDTRGRAWGWGLNADGELCLGNTRAYDLPVKLPLTDVTALAGAAGHAVYDSRGVVYSCGANGSGVLGAGPLQRGSALTPVRVRNLDGRQVITLVSSYQNAGALLSTGQYYDWGLNAEGQLGDGTTTRSSVPGRVRLPDPSPVSDVAEGGSQPYNGQTLVMLADGSLYAWGDNSYDQIDNTGPAVQVTPLRFSAPSGATYASLASSGGTSYAITTSREVYAWGEGDHGQIGNGIPWTAATPSLVAFGASVISATARNVVVSGCQ